jgi:predicted RNA binding protein YcfA (HicA-like mRNA interferase family)
MRIPRDISGDELERALRRAFGYVRTRQVGSHCRLTTQLRGEHHLTVPAHSPIKTGTLRAILNEVAAHQRLAAAEVLDALDL